MTTDEFKLHALTFWSAGIINEAQYDALVAAHGQQVGKPINRQTVKDLEEELRKQRSG